MTEKEWLGENQLSLDIWHKKYQINNESFEDWLDRVSGKNEDVKNLIRDKKFLFGGRILASRGVTDRKVTYSNCYVITPPEDNIESIFATASKLARTYSYGGGCGVDISNLRPKDAIVHNAAKSTSGAVSFMDLYSYVTGLIGQSGRRGALMISIDCHHPDIEEFINLKTKPGVCEKANISIRVTDDFMRAAINDEDWVASYTSEETGTITRTFKAQELLKLLAKRNWEWAEPGLLYWDRISNYNMLDNTDFKYAGVNPCAEEPLPAGGSCLLGSINLSEFVINPFTKDAYIDYDALQRAVYVSVVGLNQVLDEGMYLHPLQEQRNSVSDWRQIGLGTMGLADMLIKLGVVYGSTLAIVIIEEVFKCIAVSSIEMSLQLAKEHGCYVKCDKEKLVESSFIKALNLPKATLEDIKKYGLYNSQLLTCAPTGSIATMLQISTGVEPNFALKYLRKTQTLNGKDTFYEVNAKIVEDYFNTIVGDHEKSRDIRFLPDYFIESKDIAPIARIAMQSVLQKYTDASISSTINLPKEATVDEVYDIYVEAWKQGLKGVTVYRTGCYREGVLVTKKPEEVPMTSAPKRPVSLPCDIHKIKVKGEHFIVCVGLLNKTPYEVFVFRLVNDTTLTENTGTITKKSKGVYSLKSKDMEIANLLNTNISIEEKAATLYSSMLLRHGINIKYIIKTSKKVNYNISSFSSAMCRVLAKYIPAETGGKCPECGEPLIHEGGCIHCSQCSYSKCE